MDKRLLKKFIQGRCTSEESQIVMTWFNANGEEKFLELIEEDWHNQEDHTTENTDQLQYILKKIHAKISEKELEPVHKENQITDRITHYSRYNYRKYSVAAAVSLLLVATIIFALQFSNYSNNESVAEVIKKQVPIGQKATIYLSDGTSVMLNAGSSITYPEKFSENAREVKLEGEAFFKVAKDQKRPFTVISRNLTTTALGTSFNIKAYSSGDIIEVALATGKVEIRNNLNETDPVVLIPGELLNIDINSGEVRKENFVTKEKLGWTENLLYFKNAEASEVFATLERWYGVTFKFKGEIKESWKYSGEFKNKSLETVLNGISYVKQFDFTLQEGRQIDIIFK